MSPPARFARDGGSERHQCRRVARDLSIPIPFPVLDSPPLPFPLFSFIFCHS